MFNKSYRGNRIAAMVVLLVVASTVAAQQPRFSSSQETGGAPGRYRVELDLRPGDDLVAVSSQLAATYGARIEPYAEEGFSGFAIVATLARARLMSSDPRVVAITDLRSVATEAPRETRPAEAKEAAARTASPAVAVEQQGRGIATEAVPGFGSYLYDPSGNITSIDTQTFRYDAFGRLLTANLDSFGTKAYTYDRYGNILTVVTDGDATHAVRMSVDPETNQMDLPFSQSNPANMIATYDGVGNVITHNGTFVYDALNMMKETTDTKRRLHVYSASDERVAVIEVANGVEASSEWTLRDGGNRVLRRFVKDVGGTWHWKEDYVYGGTRLLAAEVPGSERVRHFHLDHLGTPRLITGNGGVRIAEKTYEPFGPKVSPATDDFEQLQFTGHERDTPALDYMHARYYQPDLRRFLSVDPAIGRANRPQSWNRYSYALNNPIRFVDPDGQRPARVYGQIRDVEPGDVIVLVRKENAQWPVHVAIVGGFKKRGFLRKPDALIYENAPVEGTGYQDSRTHQPELTNSNSAEAGAGLWNAMTTEIGGVVENRQEDGTPFPETRVADAVETVGPVRYDNGHAGEMGPETDCAGYVNQVVTELGGTASGMGESGRGRSILDWLKAILN